MVILVLADTLIPSSYTMPLADRSIRKISQDELILAAKAGDVWLLRRCLCWLKVEQVALIATFLSSSMIPDFVDEDRVVGILEHIVHSTKHLDVYHEAITDQRYASVMAWALRQSIWMSSVFLRDIVTLNRFCDFCHHGLDKMVDAMLNHPGLDQGWVTMGLDAAIWSFFEDRQSRREPIRRVIIPLLVDRGADLTKIRKWAQDKTYFLSQQRVLAFIDQLRELDEMCSIARLPNLPSEEP